MGQGPVDGAVGGPEARAVSVEAENGFRANPPKKSKLVFRQRCSERCHCMAEPCFGEGNRIHIAFADDETAALAVAKGFPRAFVAIEDLSFVEERCV